MSSSSASEAAAAASPIFHSKRTAALVPKDAHPRSKKALRDAIHNFSEQFVRALVSRLVDYCNMRRSKTVDLKTLALAAEDLLGEGASVLPRGVAREDLPQTLIFSRFKRSLKGLRTEGGSAELVTIIGFNFLRHVQEILLTIYTDNVDPKTVEADVVIRALASSRGFSRSGLPCIAYRPGDSPAQAADDNQSQKQSDDDAPKKAPRKKKEAAVPVAAAAAAAAAPADTPADAEAVEVKKAPVSRKKKASSQEAGEEGTSAPVDQKKKKKAVAPAPAAVAPAPAAEEAAAESKSPKKKPRTQQVGK
jgi:hypothetical protein